MYTRNKITLIRAIKIILKNKLVVYIMLKKRDYDSQIIYIYFTFKTEILTYWMGGWVYIFKGDVC